MEDILNQFNEEYADNGLWFKSVARFIHKLEEYGIECRYSTEGILDLNYDHCWDAALIENKKLYVSGFEDGDYIVRHQGYKDLMSAAYILANPLEVNKGKKFIRCCGTPHCVNPAHIFKISNRNKFIEDNFMAVKTEEEWYKVRCKINQLASMRQQALDTRDVLVEYTWSQMSASEAYKSRKLFEMENPEIHLTNDDILLKAFSLVVESFKRVRLGGGLAQFLSRYSLLTEYSDAPPKFRQIMELVEDSYNSKKSAYGQIEYYARTMYELAMAFGELELARQIANRIEMNKGGQQV